MNEALVEACLKVARLTQLLKDAQAEVETLKAQAEKEVRNG